MFQLIAHNFFSFVLIISLIVFIHEFGHFFVARLCGVKVDEFAIGFGLKLFGFKDKKGTLWKFCALPFGGYVKMHGDANAASMPDFKQLAKMSAAEKKISFIAKNVYQRMAIVAAGPIANFLLAIFILTILFRLNGAATVLPIVADILPQSAAAESGFEKGDEVLKIDGEEINDFAQIQAFVLSASKQVLHFEIKRGAKIIFLEATPKIQARQDLFGDVVQLKTLGISTSTSSHVDLNLRESFVRANAETYKVAVTIFKTLGELITGSRSVKELGGPVKIAQYSGRTVDMGIAAVAWFMALISINLGAMNLLPIPVLDGGHLFYYIIEALRGKPLSHKTQQIGFRFGLSIVLALMIFTTINDVLNLLK